MASFSEITNALAIDEVLENAELLANKPKRKFRKRENPFDLSDNQFQCLFRLTRQLTITLIELVTNYINPETRRSVIDIKTKVLIALRFFASGSYQMDIGCNLNMAVSQSTISRSIHEVVDALNQPAIFNSWVKFPNNLEELNHIRTQFYREYRFPGVIGCIDCTHVALFPPHINDPDYPEHIYVNRKNYHSINVQLICDWRLKILNVNATYPGNTNDCHIWNNSRVKDTLEHLHREGHTNYYLLGDQGYPLRTYLLTPLNYEPAPNTPAGNYNRAHKRTRSIIERCNGVLKMRFRCLPKHRVLHYSPIRASKIINACVVLHNMCINNNMPDPDPALEDNTMVDFGIINYIQNDDDDEPTARRVNPELAEGRKSQQKLTQNHFA